jgi:type I restriction enzyme S subunit
MKTNSIEKAWDRFRFEEITKSTRLGTAIRSKKSGNAIPLIKMGNLDWGNLKLSKVETVCIDDVPNYDDMKLTEGDFLFNTRNTPELVGKSAVWHSQYSLALADNNILIIRFRNEISPDFVSYYMNSDIGRKKLRQIAAGSTSVAAIYWKDLSKVTLDIPPFLEQRRVVEILSAWDQGIAVTERLISILQVRKKGLAQSLLSGKVRFPAFEEHWRTIHLHNIFQRVTRRVGSKKVERVLSITATVGFVDQREKFGKVIAGKNLANYVLLQKGEFAYNKGNSNAYPQGCVYLLEEFDEGAVPNVYFSFAVKSPNRANSRFYKHYFESGTLNPQLEKYISSSVRADGLFNIAFEDFFSVKVPLPSIEEQ